MVCLHSKLIYYDCFKKNRVFLQRNLVLFQSIESWWNSVMYPSTFVLLRIKDGIHQIVMNPEVNFLGVYQNVMYPSSFYLPTLCGQNTIISLCFWFFFVCDSIYKEISPRKIFVLLLWMAYTHGLYWQHCPCKHIHTIKMVYFFEYIMSVA